MRTITDTDLLLIGDVLHRLLVFMKSRNPSQESQLVELFKNTKSLTAKENLLLSLRSDSFENHVTYSNSNHCVLFLVCRHQLLVDIARKYGFSKVLRVSNISVVAVVCVCFLFFFSS